MKKRLLILIAILITIIVSYMMYKSSIKEHKITYKINNYKVEEHFHKNNKKYYYDIKITKGKNCYTYIVDNEWNKRKKIIRKIEEYKANNLVCIIPMYKKSIKDSIYCNLDKNQISIDYLLKENNEEFKMIQKKVKNKSIMYPETSKKITKYQKLNIYKENLDENEKIIIWNYKGIYILDKKNISYQKILDYDLYDNIMSTITEKYYVLFENTSVNGIKNIYYYDIRKNKLKKYELKEPISKDSYINGVYENKIYVTDNKNKKQYSIDLKKKKIEEVDDYQTSYIVYKNNEKQILSKSDFFAKKQYFTASKKGNYYYYKEENKIYKTITNDKKNSILLFELDNIKEWTVINDNIILLSDDTIYLYDDVMGLRKIISSNELKYNYKNIYQLWKK